MDDLKLHDLAAWVTEAGVAGRPETELLAGFSERAVAAGLPLGTLIVVLDTLHPTHEGHGIRWRRTEAETTFMEYGSAASCLPSRRDRCGQDGSSAASPTASRPCCGSATSAATPGSRTALARGIIPLLNDYAEVVVSAVHEAGGDMLKLIGDGVLAIFRAGDSAIACAASLRAAIAAEERIARLNDERTAKGRPVNCLFQPGSPSL